jgi:hypothetical protein
MKHNKKRNTAFLYEALLKELTKSVIEKDVKRKNDIIAILKEHFSNGKILYKELSLYKTLNETKNIERKIAEKILREARMEYSFLPPQDIFKEQTKVVNKINNTLSPSVFSNFVKNYKDLASIYQVFNNSTPIKNRVLLEEFLIEMMSSNEEKKEKEMKPLDRLTYNTFIKKFNKKYSDVLLKEQKDLLTNYLISFSDDGLSLKIFLNEELARIKGKIQDVLELKEIKQDKSMKDKTNKILEKLELFRQKEFDIEMINELLKVQYFLDEANKN